MKVKLASVHVLIGKSKQLITYTFKEEDFIRIEGDRLFIQNEIFFFKSVGRTN